MVKVVFFGTPAFAVPTLDRLIASAHPVLAVVSQPDRPRDRGHKVRESPVKARARAAALPVLQPERMKDSAFLDQMTGLAPDLGVVAAYGKILPDQLLAIPRLGMINVHASLLPKYRGAAPIQRAIMAGESETGITIIHLIREMDAGPMLGRVVRPIGPAETGEQVEAALAELGADLLMDVVGQLNDSSVVAEEQDHQHASFAPRLTKDDGVIDWAAPARAVRDQVRALQPWPHAYSYLGAARFLILRTAVAEAPVRPAGAAEPTPGEVLEAAGERLVVAAGAGSALVILEIQPEGRRPVSTRAFLAGHRIGPGSVFGPAPS